MKYNLTQYSQTISNTVEGNISLTTDEVIRILSTTTAEVTLPTSSGTVSGTLVLDCDLGARVHIGEIRYYFDSVAPESTVSSGIKFYYKNESFETYVSLDTYYNANYYYTVVSGTYTPRYIRVEHIVTSGTVGSLNGFQALNDDTYVDFGEDGTKTNHNVNLSLENAIVEINEMFVYNSGAVKANAKLIIEPQNNAADDILSISNNVDGPWYGVYREEDMVAGPDLWETGNMDDVEVSADVLKLTSPNTVGTYTTRIVSIDEYQRLTFNMMSYDYPTLASGKSIIATDDIDTLENIEVRSYNSRPMDRASYIEMTGSYASSTKYTQHRWVEDGSVAETSSDWSAWGQSGNFWEYWYDSVREDEYIVDKPYYTSGNTTIYFRIRRKNGTLTSKTISNTSYTSDCWYNTYRLTPDSTGGFWIYYYLNRGSTIDGGNYYLRYYNSSFSLVYDRSATSTQGTFLYDMDVVYESSGDMWYTDRDLSTVFKINTDGTILTSYLATESIRGILALNDGGCWFVQDQALIRLDTDGSLVDTIELPSEIASYIYSDFNGGFWLQDGLVIRNLEADGTELFNVTIPNLYFMTPIDSGVIVKHHDGSVSTTPKASYISRDHKRAMRTWDYPRTEGNQEGNFDYNRYGVRSHTYDDLVDDHASHFPIAIDNQWNTFSEWTTVSLRDYNFTNEQYHQIRFTLRADNSANSPEVYGLWTQRAIEIPDIYPENYGRYYLRSDVTYLNPQDTGDYTSKIRAYWLLNTE